MVAPQELQRYELQHFYLASEYDMAPGDKQDHGMLMDTLLQSIQEAPSSTAHGELAQAWGRDHKSRPRGSVLCLDSGPCLFYPCTSKRALVLGSQASYKGRRDPAQGLEMFPAPGS